MDGEVGTAVPAILEKQGMTSSSAPRSPASNVRQDAEGRASSPPRAARPRRIEADVVLVSIGRVPYTEGLGLKEAGVAMDKRGRVEIDDHFATNVQGIYAIGDVIRGPDARAQGRGRRHRRRRNHRRPGRPRELRRHSRRRLHLCRKSLRVGKTEEELKAAGIAYKVGKFPFTANGRAKTNQQTDGFVKFLADAKTDRVLGVHIVGVEAGEMIARVPIADGVRRRQRKTSRAPAMRIRRVRKRSRKRP